jgi:hypothetical protein
MSPVVVLVITCTRRRYKFNQFACLQKENGGTYVLLYITITIGMKRYYKVLT